MPAKKRLASQRLASQVSNAPRRADRRQPDYYTGAGLRSNLSASIQRHYSGNDARVTGAPGSQENLTVETLPARPKKKDRRYRRLRSENTAPTSATPGAWSQATAIHPSGARY